MGWAGLICLIAALFCLYHALNLGVATEEGMGNPDITQHSEIEQMKQDADRWMWGCGLSFAGVFTVGILTFRVKQSDR